MRQAKVVVLGAVAVVAATAAGVMPAIVTGGSPPPPAVSPSEPQQAAAGIGVDQGRSAPPPGGVESPPVIPSGEPGRVEPGLGTGQDRPVPPAGGRAASASVVLRELQAFPSCETFLEHAQAQAIELVGPWGLPQYGMAVSLLLSDDIAAAVEAAPPAPAPAPPPPAAALPPGESGLRVVENSGSAFSGTNVQEAGIDEPDIVKTDGTLMFVVTHERLYALAAAAAVPRVVDSIALDGWDHRLLLAGERVLVISQTDPHFLPYEEAASERILPPSWPQTTITLVDAGDPGALHVVETLTVEGVFINARQIGSSVRVVVSSVPTGLEFTGPARQGRVGEVVATLFAMEQIGDEEERARQGRVGEVVATALNRGVIRRTTVEDWLPGFVHHDRYSGKTTTGLADCHGVRHPGTFSGLGMLTVLTLDVESGVQPVDTDSVMTDGQLVYASTTGLYVATSQWLDWEEIATTGRGPERIETVIHKFATDEPRRTEYRASGTVRGTLLNQFSMSEHEGYLRVASTVQPSWWSDGPTGQSQSFVTVLAEAGDELREVGGVGGLGKGEQIYAVRFIGDVGYVVTFRQVDPLYTVDLSDPTNPRVRGELKILGYSAYLHPVGDGLLLGVGQDASKQGRIRGTQISLFDISDLDDPTRLHAERLGRDTHSEVEYDHHAFLWWPARSLAVLPVYGYGFDERAGETWTSSAIGAEVTRDRGIERVGSVSHPGREPVRRSLIIGDRLFTVSEAGVMANLPSAWDERWWVPFP